MVLLPAATAGVEEHVCIRSLHPDALLYVLDDGGDNLRGVRRLRRDFSHLPVVLLAGATPPNTIDVTAAGCPSAILGLPYRRDQLLAAVRVAVLRNRPTPVGPPFVEVVLADGQRRLDIRQICYVRSEHVYLNIHLLGGEVVTARMRLSVLFNELPGGNFLRPHRSYLVNLTYVDAWEPGELRIGPVRVPISRTRRRRIVTRLQSAFPHLG